MDSTSVWCANPPPNEPPLNGRNARRHPDITQQLIDKEVELGHILGPFDEPPLEGLVYSPIDIVPKPGKNKYHLIHNLAAPYRDSLSVNSCIREENSSVQYHYIDEVIKMGVALGQGTWACRIDIEFAFHNQPMSLKMLRFLAFKFNDKTFLNSSLPFGASSSCQLFEKIAGLLEYVVTNETGCNWISFFR